MEFFSKEKKNKIKLIHNFLINNFVSSLIMTNDDGDNNYRLSKLIDQRLSKKKKINPLWQKKNFF